MINHKVLYNFRSLFSRQTTDMGITQSIDQKLHHSPKPLPGTDDEQKALAESLNGRLYMPSTNLERYQVFLLLYLSLVGGHRCARPPEALVRESNKW